MNEKNKIYNLEDIIKFFNEKKFDHMKLAAENILERIPDDPDALNALGLSYKYSGDIQKAREIFVKLVNSNPKKDYIYSNVGNFFYDVGNINQSLQCHKHAIKLNPKNLNSLNQIGLCLSNQGKDSEAIEFYKKSISIDGNLETSYDNLGNSLRNLQRYKEASDAYNLSTKILSRCQQLECLYLLGDKDGFYEKLSELKKDNISHPLAATLSTHASIRFEEKDDYPFCNKPFNFIQKNELLKSKHLNKNLIEDFFKVFNNLGVSKKEQSLLLNGYQSSGNIFLIDDPAIKKIKNLVENQINIYKKNSDKNATFISFWPEKYTLYGWIIVINDGGSLSGHMHKEGWLSGSLYLERPEKNSENDGDIVFSLHGSNYPKDDKFFPSKIINIEKGDMVLFPSSLFHATIPFNSNKKRITLAFDVIPHYD